MSDLKHFAPVLNDTDILHQRDDMASHLMDWRGQFDGAAQGVLFPRSTEQVAQIMAIAASKLVGQPGFEPGSRGPQPRSIGQANLQAPNGIGAYKTLVKALSMDYSSLGTLKGATSSISSTCERNILLQQYLSRPASSMALLESSPDSTAFL